ncbi:SAP domain-containing protein [Microbacterium sp. VKM Ac-2923]|uniref:SAP domain-containing protein n=1 Tax=Microbacterium sp. VKM Ac-2923 TaxID=2929476 RepID=UPI001FB2D56A|nr:SAP domain-containing protein [Microbacterium sp. VKM Ac-2923]MCJ1709232.1 SAP domain-containing protein [Microbacterium sp. VKM Ac-2923]
MSQPRKITSGIVHLMHNGRPVTLRPGDTVPEWANITNPRLFIGADADTADENPGGGQTPPAGAQTPPPGEQTPPGDKSVDVPEVSLKQSADELRAIAKTLDLDQSGTKPVLVERINAHYVAAATAAAEAAEAEPAGEAGQPGEEDGRPALEERARAAGITDFDENTTDEELEALIEDEQE